MKKQGVIKSRDSCQKCKFFDWGTYCTNNVRCEGCENFREVKGEMECLCHTVKMNTPCPYFVEAEE